MPVKYFIGFISLLLFTLTFWLSEKSIQIPQNVSSIIDSYVQIIDGKRGLGSGVVIKVNGTNKILTCYHVIDNCPSLFVCKLSKDNLLKGQKAKLEFFIEDIDLAILELDYPRSLKPVNLYIGEPSIGETCYTIGTPAGIYGCLDRSIISRKDYKTDGISRLFYLVPSFGWYGSSGGGLYVYQDNEYRLCGIICMMFKTVPQGPLLVESNITINSFLKRYKEWAQQKN
jgi:hypothetical protein